jgi:hypothetical protein
VRQILGTHSSENQEDLWPARWRGDAVTGEAVQFGNGARVAEVEDPGMKVARPKRLLAIDDRLLMVFGDSVRMGRDRGGAVDVVLSGWVRPEHAQIVREAHGYRLTVSPGAAVTIEGAGDVGNGGHWLAEGDVLRFDRFTCRWVFHQRNVGSGTVVLESADPSCHAAHAGGGQFRTVVLASDEVVIGRVPPAHVVWPDLPSDTLTLRAGAAEPLVEVARGRVWVGGPGMLDVAEPVTAFQGEGVGVDGGPCPLIVPGWLFVEPELTEGEWLVRQLYDPVGTGLLALSVGAGGGHSLECRDPQEKF